MFGQMNPLQRAVFDSNNGQMPQNPLLHLGDAAVAEGFAFVQSELAKRDPRLYEPLNSVTWMRDIVSKDGGGPVDVSVVHNIDFGMTAPNEFGFISNATTDIAVMQANVSQDTYRVLDFATKTRISYIDMLKSNSIGRSLDDMYDKGLRINYNNALDQMVYLGSTTHGLTGLLNNSRIVSSLALNNGTGSSRLFADKTADQILSEINQLLNRCWARSEYDQTGMPNQIGMPPAVFTELVSRKVSDAGDKSIMTYLLENNVAQKMGINLVIVPMRQLIGIGASSTNRIVAYVNQEDRVHIDLPVALSRVMTNPSASDAAYVSLFYAQVGEVKFLYEQCVEYLDGV